MTSGLQGKRILVTGATGQFGFPLALELASANEVIAVARFGDERRRRVLDEAGVATIAWDLVGDDLERLPAEADYVVQTAAMMPQASGRTLVRHSEADRAATFEANVDTTGRLMRRYRESAGFLHSSSAGVYAYQGERRLREDDPFGAL